MPYKLFAGGKESCYPDDLKKLIANLHQTILFLSSLKQDLALPLIILCRRISESINLVLTMMQRSNYDFKLVLSQLSTQDQQKVFSIRLNDFVIDGM